MDIKHSRDNYSEYGQPRRFARAVLIIFNILTLIFSQTLWDSTVNIPFLPVKETEAERSNDNLAPGPVAHKRARIWIQKLAFQSPFLTILLHSASGGTEGHGLSQDNRVERQVRKPSQTLDLGGRMGLKRADGGGQPRKWEQ